MHTINWIGKEAVVKHHKEVPFRLRELVAELTCSPRPQAGEGLGERGVAMENRIAQGDNLHIPKGPIRKPNKELLV